MIKKWHKWFVCIFAVFFVSIFFVFDAMFFYKGSNSNIPPIIADDDIISDDEPIKDDDNKKDNPTDPKPSESIFNYTNGYQCLNDTLTRLDSQRYYKSEFKTSYSTTNIIDFTQTIEGTKYFNDTAFTSDIYVHCNSSLGKTNYERIITEDRQNFVAYFVGMDSDFNYDMADAYKVEYDLESFLNKFPERLLPFVLTPKQGKDKLVKYDRDTNKTYYIVSFSFNLNGIPDSFYEMMKKNMGASSVDYKSFQMTFYISKKTGLIEKLSQTEVFSASINILTPQVRATTLTKITYYNEKITPIFKN